MPYRVVLHNGEDEQDYAKAATERELRAALHRMIEDKEDDWRDGDSLVVFKITDLDAKNEKFWDDLMADMRNRR